MGGDAHDGAGAVGEERIVGDEDGDLFAVESVGAVGPDEDTGLLLVGGEAFDFGTAPGLFDVGLYLFLLVGGG